MLDELNVAGCAYVPDMNMRESVGKICEMSLSEFSRK
jgi:hypothetical protein